MELTREQLLDSYRQMRTIRAFEERLNDMVMAGKLSGFLQRVKHAADTGIHMLYQCHIANSLI